VTDGWPWAAHNFTLLNDFMTLSALLRDSPNPLRGGAAGDASRRPLQRTPAASIRKKTNGPFRAAKRIVSHDLLQLFEIIGASESSISRKRLFSRTWAPFRFALFSTQAAGSPKAGPESGRPYF
jgi:hypothetical protein